jgi:hypothetical protein
MRILLSFLLLAGLVLAEDAKPALTQEDQTQLIVAQLQQETANLKAQVANLMRELTYTKACYRNSIPFNRCQIQPDGAITTIPVEPPAAPAVAPAKP